MTGGIVETNNSVYRCDSEGNRVIIGRIGRTADYVSYYDLELQLHREDGPAIEYYNGDKCWYINGKLHREDGPAVEYSDGTKEWFINGECHRVDGPAVEWYNGSTFWYVNGNNVTNEVNKWREDMGITNEYLTPEETALFVLYFGNVK